MANDSYDNHRQLENTNDNDEEKVEKLLEKLFDQPFRRKTQGSTKFNEMHMKQNLLHSLKALGYTIDEADTGQMVDLGLEVLAQTWRRKDVDSEIAFQGLLTILEYCLNRSVAGYSSFEQFINALGYNAVQFWRYAVPYIYDSDLTYGTKFRDSLLFSLTLYDINNGKSKLNALGYNAVQFWRYAVPYIYDSDLTYGTKFRDSLLFSLTLYDINNGKSKLRELYASVPGVRKSLLGVHAKRFGERFHHLQRRLSISREAEKSRRSRLSISRGASESSVSSRELSKEVIASGGLANTHFQQRVINVSNAPPVSLKREKTGEWEIKQGSGGLVSAVDPVMSKDKENVWLANLGMNLHKKSK
ncbi:unnamed protein product [Wuchereria bancrofti]|uniref:Uncharacterized protein n=1 Tax=Wuchereria bancrofti TaxID=6293 RepID=A0A3P7FQ92_WUCBA|nr:unnamed protein product [Wuchereria bancrofti]